MGYRGARLRNDVDQLPRKDGLGINSWSVARTHAAGQGEHACSTHAMSSWARYDKTCDECPFLQQSAQTASREQRAALRLSARKPARYQGLRWRPVRNLGVPPVIASICRYCTTFAPCMHVSALPHWPCANANAVWTDSDLVPCISKHAPAHLQPLHGAPVDGVHQATSACR